MQEATTAETMNFPQMFSDLVDSIIDANTDDETMSSAMDNMMAQAATIIGELLASAENPANELGKFVAVMSLSMVESAQEYADESEDDEQAAESAH